jgi:hypothetical protein
VKLRGVERAIVDTAKIREYLLSESHPVGRFKAAFFVSLGYSLARWETLETDLRRHAKDNDVHVIEVNDFGQKYTVRGNLVGPRGKGAVVVAVWIVLRGQGRPRFVTAFPGASS